MDNSQTTPQAAPGPPESPVEGDRLRALWAENRLSEAQLQKLRVRAQKHDRARCKHETMFDGACKLCAVTLYDEARGLTVEALEQLPPSKRDDLAGITDFLGEIPDLELYQRVEEARRRQAPPPPPPPAPPEPWRGEDDGARAVPKRPKRARRDNGREQPSREEEPTPKRSGDHPLVRFARWVKLGLLKELNAPATSALLVLAVHANKEAVAFPSASTIARLTGGSRRHIIEGLRLLRAGGIIHTKGRRNQREGKAWGSIMYELLDAPSPEAFSSEVVPRLRAARWPEGVPRRRGIARRDAGGRILQQGEGDGARGAPVPEK